MRCSQYSSSQNKKNTSSLILLSDKDFSSLDQNTSVSRYWEVTLRKRLLQRGIRYYEFVSCENCFPRMYVSIRRLYASRYTGSPSCITIQYNYRIKRDQGSKVSKYLMMYPGEKDRDHNPRSHRGLKHHHDRHPNTPHPTTNQHSDQQHLDPGHHRDETTR